MNEMKTRYRLIFRGVRGGMFYCVDKVIQEQEKADQRLDQLGLFGDEGRFERFTFTSLRLCGRWLTLAGLQQSAGKYGSFL